MLNVIFSGNWSQFTLLPPAALVWPSVDDAPVSDRIAFIFSLRWGVAWVSLATIGAVGASHGIACCAGARKVALFSIVDFEVSAGAGWRAGYHLCSAAFSL